MTDDAIDEPEQRDLAGDPVGQATLSFDSTPTLKFDTDFVVPIVDGEKTLTLRHDLDIDPKPGMRLRLAATTENVGVFARAELVDVEQLTVAAAAERDFDGHRTYDGLDDVLAELREYYPDATIGPETLLTALRFELLDRVD
jgi:hypothetical protein